MSARDLYESFRGERANRTVRTGVKLGPRWITRKGDVNILIPHGGLVLVGHTNAIEYDTVRGGETVQARHVFAPGSRPVLLAGSEPGQLFLCGTRYLFTERGIVDQDGRGRSIDFDENTNKTKFLR